MRSSQLPLSSCPSTSSSWMVTGRAGRSTSLPCRASWYSFCPLILIAEYMGGTCITSPVKRGSSASSSCRVTWTGCCSSTSPEVSCVLVTQPKCSPATYSLSPVSAKDTARVACPTNTGSTPVAMGSSVPAWPTLRVFRTLRSLPHTSMDVQPAGLSIITMPFAMSYPTTS